ncbi:MAG: CmpA/NrtA family ABC transporter substrate-binding protein [Verrucomicrobia bacterium]|nr:CmpA/NrtA family ABC transporter substrate-binding protein [Verrucomicrobiota bacterium]
MSTPPESPASMVADPVPPAGRIRLGFIPLTDAAPILVADAQGFFRRRGLEVQLSREVGWATVRDKIIYRELDAAHAVAPMAAAITLGLGCLAIPCLSAYVLNAHGNAITLSTALWKRGVRDAVTLRDEIQRTRHERTLVLGVVFAHSAQQILLRDWLRGGQINPDKDVRIVVVPPAQLHRNLAAGTIDGYCVGEPYNTQAVREKTGWIAAISADLAPGHPEKALLVREDFAATRPEEHLALVGALQEAAILCDDPAFRPELVRLLARPEYLDVPARLLTPALLGPIDPGMGREPLATTSYIRFSQAEANVPTPLRAQWIIDGFARHGLLPKGLVIPPDLARRTFRSDLFSQARARHSAPA